MSALRQFLRDTFSPRFLFHDLPLAAVVSLVLALLIKACR